MAKGTAWGSRARASGVSKKTRMRSSMKQSVRAVTEVGTPTAMGRAGARGIPGG
jgi:hypothetical protein